MEVTGKHFDDVIIGAGMAGLAAGIRLAHFGRKVIILERHNASGGLNSFYSIDGRKYDVGLHAVTNFVKKGVKGTPLGKLFRQLRISRDEFALCEQIESKIAFPSLQIRFNNDFELLKSEIVKHFPKEKDNFQQLIQRIDSFDALSLGAKDLSAKAVVAEYLKDPLLQNMVFCPLMYYGSAVEDDMDFGQFVIMFNSIYREGFARPFDGVRTIIRTLSNKYKCLGGIRKMKLGVKQIITEGVKVSKIILDNDQEITADNVISTAGIVETLRLCNDQPVEASTENEGQLSFVETISVLDKQPRELGWNDTIIFFNDSDTFNYRKSKDLVDTSSGVICFPNNYQYEDGQELAEGMLRVTAMANYQKWKELPKGEYISQKEKWYEAMNQKALSILPPLKTNSLIDHTIAHDMFTPLTVKKFTGHINGAIYGAPNKTRDGTTHLDNLFISGTDQGFLGIIGAMLSGVSIANAHILS